jgi:rhodanese-related sulfurtransferase
MAHGPHSPGFIALVQDAKRRTQEVTIPEYRQNAERGQTVVLVDVREDHEWEKGRIPGARHLGKGIIERDIEREIPDKSSALVLYCGGGYRSALVADNLQRMGYSNVRSLAGGIRGWIESGLPIET